MDKEWMHLPSRLVPEYEEGVQKFLAQARKYAKTRETILCPCKRCKNKKYMKFDQVYEHLIIKGFDTSYTIWFFHGEIYTSQFQGEGSSAGVQEEKDGSREEWKVTSKEMDNKKKNGQLNGQVVGENMKVIKECPHESPNTTNSADDAISLVFGKEARGRVRGMGVGVTPSKFGASVQQNGTIKQLQNMVHSLQQEMHSFQQEMQEMKTMFFQNMRQQNEQEQKVIKECPLESQNTTNIEDDVDDAISRVSGKEARDRVRGMGFGVAQSKFGASVQQNVTIKQLQSMVHSLQQEMQEMRSMFFPKYEATKRARTG